MGRSRVSAALRLRAMHDRLVKAYGPQYWWPAQTQFEVIVGAYLTQNTSWKAVEVSLSNLRRADVLSISGLRRIPLSELQSLIRPSGFQTRKALALKAFVTMLDMEFGGLLNRLAAGAAEQIRARLLLLPGVGPETADAILLYALGHAVPVADEYLRRIVSRHQLIHPEPEKNPKGYEALVQLTNQAFSVDAVPDRIGLLNEFHALTVAVGKAHCGKVPDCEHCPLSFDLGKQMKKAHSGKE
ncbi:MAG: base excision DNA repair protein [Acidobacteria bacterium]|nr:base excision DNA repair protein [Acidobacteriota bacterium]